MQSNEKDEVVRLNRNAQWKTKRNPSAMNPETPRSRNIACTTWSDFVFRRLVGNVHNGARDEAEVSIPIHEHQLARFLAGHSQHEG